MSASLISDFQNSMHISWDIQKWEISAEIGLKNANLFHYSQLGLYLSRPDRSSTKSQLSTKNGNSLVFRLK